MNSLNILENETTGLSSELNQILSKFNTKISKSKFLVLGGAGSIGQEVVKKIFQFKPKKLHIVDLSENNLVELVRDIRSSYGYIKGEFKVHALDIGSREYDKFIEQDGNYDYVMNLSALKHVRSEKDPFTLIRLISTNIFNVEKTLKQSIKKGVKNYFSVSTDKAANPANIMGASKRIMELFMFKESSKINVTSARFANVLFSDGSLLYSFNQRISKKQPIVAPLDIKRYFISRNQAAELCLIAALEGNNRDIFFPKLNSKNDLKSFKGIVLSYLKEKGLSPIECKTEQDARNMIIKNKNKDMWPCFFSSSETTGEKPFEEFYSLKESINLSRYSTIGVVENPETMEFKNINRFKVEIENFKKRKKWERYDIIQIFKNTLSEFDHIEKNKFLDDKM